MASQLTFFWRANAASIGAGDYSAISVEPFSTTGDPAFSGTYARVGTSGMQSDSGDYILITGSGADFVTAAEGSVGVWIRPTAAGCHLWLQSRGGWTENLALYVNAEGSGLFKFNDQTGDVSSIGVPDGTFSLAGAWYFIVCRWKAATNQRSFEVYDTDLALVDSAYSEVSWSLPSQDLGRFTIGSQPPAANWMDSLFASNLYDEPLLLNALIDDYADYDTNDAPAGEGGPGVLTQHIMRAG